MPGRYARVLDDDDLLALLQSKVKSAGGQSAFAREWNLDRSYLNQVLRGKKALGGPSILSALNLRIVYTPVQGGEK
jgi:hypothetical protein